MGIPGGSRRSRSARSLSARVRDWLPLPTSGKVLASGKLRETELASSRLEAERVWRSAEAAGPRHRSKPPHSIAEQRTITDGRIVAVGKGFLRKPPKRVDYLLRFRRDFPLAIVEAEATYKTAADGLQHATPRLARPPFDRHCPRLRGLPAAAEANR